MAALLDEILGLCAEVQQDPQANGERLPIFAVKLETTYKRRVSVPGDCVVKTWAFRKEGRKRWAKGLIVSPGESEVYTEGKVLCVETKSKPAKL